MNIACKVFNTDWKTLVIAIHYMLESEKDGISQEEIFTKRIVHCNVSKSCPGVLL